jgi:hypothetical protein
MLYTNLSSRFTKPLIKGHRKMPNVIEIALTLSVVDSLSGYASYGM